MRKQLATLAALVLVAAPSFASPILSYNDIDLAYQHTFFDQDEGQADLDDGNGLLLRGRYSPVESFFLETSYTYTDTGVNHSEVGGDLDNHELRYGVGGYYNFCDEWHLVGRVGGIHNHLDYHSGQTLDDGYYMGAESRYDYEGKAELAAGVTYDNVGRDGSWVYDGTVIVPVADSVGVLLNAAIDDETDLVLTAGFRFAL